MVASPGIRTIPQLDPRHAWHKISTIHFDWKINRQCVMEVLWSTDINVDKWCGLGVKAAEVSNINETWSILVTYLVQIFYI